MPNKKNADAQQENPYQDIIHLPHPVSKKHPRMPIADRAAQFAPFAALTGHEALIRETQRLHEEKYEKNSCRNRSDKL